MNINTLTAALVGAAAFAAPGTAAAASSYEASVLDDSPLIYLQMEETTGSTALDASGHGRHGVYDRAMLAQHGPFSEAGNAVALSGGAQVTASVEKASGSVELWVNPQKIRRGDAPTFVAHGDPAGDGWALGIGGKRRLTLATQGGETSLRRTISSNTWTMLTVTWSAKKADVYMNGTLARSVTLAGAAQAPSASAAAVTVGGQTAPFDQAFAGRVDEFALYETALTPAQIKAHFTAANLPVNVTPPAMPRTAKVGVPLTITAGTWTGATIAAAYEWQSCDVDGEDCEVLAGVTGTTYVPTTADVDRRLQVLESVGNAAGTTSTMSDLTDTVQGDPAPTPDPGSGDGSGGSGDGSGSGGSGDGSGTGGSGTGGSGTGGSGDGSATGGSGTGTDGGTPVASGGTAAIPGTGTPVLEVLDTQSSSSCLRLVTKSRKKLRRVGSLRLRVSANGCIRAGAPVRAAVKVPRTKRLKTVTYKLDGKKVRAARKTKTAKLTAAKLAAGKHTLRVRITLRTGKPRTFKVRLRTAAI